MPTIETLREMGVNLENNEEFNIEKMENRAEGNFMYYLNNYFNFHVYISINSPLSMAKSS